MRRPILSAISSALAATVILGTIIGTAPIAHAADVTATDGSSRITIVTPIAAPATGACTTVPFRYVIAPSVSVATPTIVDTRGGLVARGSQLIPGQGTDQLNVCGANLSGKAPPYSLRLQLDYVAADRTPTVVTSPATFGFAPRTITCRKTRRPHKGRVQAFVRPFCPRGWSLVRR